MVGVFAPVFDDFGPFGSEIWVLFDELIWIWNQSERRSQNKGRVYFRKVGFIWGLFEHWSYYAIDTVVYHLNTSLRYTHAAQALDALGLHERHEHHRVSTVFLDDR